MAREDAPGGVYDPDWLRERAIDALEFYYPACVAEERGGFVAQIDEVTGDVTDPAPRHLVASSRFVVNFSRGVRIDGPDWCEPAAERGLSFLFDHHRDAERGGYDRLLEGTEPVDRSRSCYGHAFVLLAFAEAATAGVSGAEAHVEATFDLLDERFFEPERGLYRSRWNADWTESEDYRGQNANMHACEALIAAHEATGEGRYLDRALTVARALTVELAAETDGTLWEHYTETWEHDFEYNEDEPRHQFRPWGYQPGHHAEWAKLLATLARRREGDAWLTERARELFDFAVESGWDEAYGGFYYTLDRDGDPVVSDKYGWPVAEAIGAAATLADLTGEERYREWYERLWAYAEAELLAGGGNWYGRLDRENDRIPPDDGPAVEPGYHPIGASLAGIDAFGDRG